MKEEGTDLFVSLPPTMILEAHYGPEELKQLRKTLEAHGCPVTTSIFQAELAVTKLTQEKRARREIHDIIRTQSQDDTSSTKEIDVVREKWIRQCIDKGKLVDWPFTDSTWRIVRLTAIPSIIPRKRQRTPEKLKVPGIPAGKRRTLSRSGSISAPEKEPSGALAASFEPASPNNPTSKQFQPSQTSTVPSSGEEDQKFDYREVYSCRRKSPLICKNETFVKLLMEIRLARELAL
jgi:hypothetical protein